MPLLILFTHMLVLVSGSAWATDPTMLPPGLGGSSSSNVTIVHPSPGVSYLYDQHGHSVTILEAGPGMSWYSQKDATGQTRQGYLVEPVRPHVPT